MSVAIVGLGLVTPFGTTPAEHVVFLRAGVPAPPPSPFEQKTGERIDVRYCTWLGSAMPVEERLVHLGTRALRDAIPSALDPSAVQILLCLPKGRPGLREEATEALAHAAAPAERVRRFFDDAGAFAALRESATLVKDARVAVVLAVDSYVTLDAVEEYVRHPPSPWDLEPLPLSEGAAAVALMEAHVARRHGLAILGSVAGASVAAGAATDDNDAPVDGRAMALAIRALPAGERVRAAFGPWKADRLRQDEWQLASAIARERFAQPASFVCFEASAGRLGAASGLANLVYGLSALRLGALEDRDASNAPMFAWAISPDGTRGVALASGREA